MRNRLAWLVAGVFWGGVLMYVALWQSRVLTPTLNPTRPGPAPATAQARKQASPATSETQTSRTADSILPPIENLKASDIFNSFQQARPGGRPHEATDIMEPRGTPVHAMVDGVIEKLFLSKPGGNTIYEFDDAQEYCYYYAHLDRYAEGIQEHQHVKRGTVIAYVGSTGNASAEAPHLHLAINVIGPEKKWWKGTPIDPYPILIKSLGHNAP